MARRTVALTVFVTYATRVEVEMPDGFDPETLAGPSYAREAAIDDIAEAAPVELGIAGGSGAMYRDWIDTSGDVMEVPS